MRNRSRSVWLALALLSCAPAVAHSAATHWYRAKARHFVLYSAAERDSVLRLARGLERMADLVARMGLGSKSGQHPRTVILAFPDKKSFQPHRPIVDGHPQDVAGWVTHQPYGHLIGYASYDPRGRMVAQHEYAHTIVAEVFQRVPICLNEGLADFFSTFTEEGDRVKYGHPIPWYQYEVNAEPLFGMDELFAVTPASPAYRGGDAMQRFYAESWTLTHYLSHSSGLTSRLLDLAGRIAGGAPARDAFTAVYPEESWDQLPARLKAYASSEDIEPHEVSFSDPLEQIPVEVVDAPPGEVAAQIGLWRARMESLDPAETGKWFDQALAESPDLPLARAGQGILALRAHQLDQAADRFHAAAKGAPDAEALCVAGVGLAGVGFERDSTGHDPLIADAHEILGRAVALDPSDAMAKVWLDHTEPRGAGGQTTVLEGHLDPTAHAATDSLTQLVHAGRYAQALVVADQLEKEHPDQHDQIEAVRAMVKAGQAANEATDEYNLGVTATRERDYEAATHHFERARDLGGGVGAQAKERLDDLAGMIEYQRGFEAAKKKDYATALKWFEKAEAAARRPELKADAEKHVHELRAYVGTRGAGKSGGNK